MHFLLICKTSNRYERRKSRDKDFLDIQGQLTLESIVESGRNSKTSKLLYLFFLPARIKKVHSKMKALERSQCFSNCKYKVIFPDVQWQLTSLSEVRSGQNANSSEVLW